jgi:hypothetical protein
MSCKSTEEIFLFWLSWNFFDFLIFFLFFLVNGLEELSLVMKTKASSKERPEIVKKAPRLCCFLAFLLANDVVDPIKGEDSFTPTIVVIYDDCGLSIQDRKRMEEEELHL